MYNGHTDGIEHIDGDTQHLDSNVRRGGQEHTDGIEHIDSNTRHLDSNICREKVMPHGNYVNTGSQHTNGIEHIDGTTQHLDSNIGKRDREIPGRVEHTDGNVWYVDIRHFAHSDSYTAAGHANYIPPNVIVRKQSRIKITGIFTIQDAIYLGYPFMEAILSVMPIVDEFLVNAGGSTDATLKYLKRLQKIFPKVQIYELPFFSSERWETVDMSLNKLIEKASGDWIIEVQGDEIWHEKDIKNIPNILKNAYNYNSIRHKVLECSWTNIDDRYIYKNVRIVRNIPNLRSYWGGDDFHIGKAGVPTKGYTSHNVPLELEIDIPYYHFHRIFPKNAYRQAERQARYIATKDGDRQYIPDRIDLKKIKPPDEEKILTCLPTLMKGLSQYLEYQVREELFDKKWLSQITGLKYD